MIKPGDVYRKQEKNWVSRHILDEVVIMPLCRSAQDMQYIYSISNETGSRIWQLIDGGHSTCDIQEILKSECQGQTEQIERETLQFIEDCLEAGLIEKTRLRPQTTNRKPQTEIKKRPYKSPEISKVKLQPEQAVLACCTDGGGYKTNAGINWCQMASCVIIGGCGSIDDDFGYNASAS